MCDLFEFIQARCSDPLTSQHQNKVMGTCHGAGKSRFDWGHETDHGEDGQSHGQDEVYVESRWGTIPGRLYHEGLIRFEHVQTDSRGHEQRP